MASSGDCFHCGWPVPEGLDLTVKILGETRPMCCAGCEAVATAIVENQLEDFYTHRTDRSNKAEALVPDALREMQLYDDEILQQSFVVSSDNELREAALILEGITCAACVWLNERHVQALPGVKVFQVNYSSHRAQLIWDNSEIKLSDVLQAIAQIGFQAHPFDPGRQEALHKQERSLAIRRIGVAGVGMMQVMMLAVALYLGAYQGMSEGIKTLLRWASLVVATPVVFYASSVFFRAAWRDLKFRQLGMDVPVSVAIGGAYLASVWATVKGTGEVYFDSVTMFTFFLLLGRFLELSARHKAGQVADELVRLMPATTLLKTDSGTEPIAVTALQKGDLVIVKPGDTIPADGEVIAGHSSVDESLLTGESMPRAKSQGDALIGGTINRGSPLTLRIERLGSETTLAGISRLLERAQAEKPQIAILANRVAGWFVAALLLVAVVVFTFWYWRDSADAIWITLSVLVVTCPCALSLATPVAITVAVGVLTRMGLLTTRGHALETLARVDDVIFDKTGTLTQGKLKVLEVEPLANLSTIEVRQVAAGLEAYSEHPIATALRDGVAAADNIEVVETETGLGVIGRWQGELLRIGNLDFIKQWHPQAELLEAKTGSSIFLVSEKQLMGRILLGDEIRPDAAAAVSALQSQQIRVHLLSGDNHEVVGDLAGKLDVPQFRARQLPDDKLEYVRSLQAQGRRVAMIGDGVNDAPVLAGADVSIAMGGGAQLAQASADMVLLSDELARLPQGIARSQQTLRVIRQNLMWAIGYNLLALPLAAAGYIAPWMAAIGMSFSSLLVVVNALRLKDKRK